MLKVVDILYELGCWLEENEHPPECLDGEPGGLVGEQAQPVQPASIRILPCAGTAEALSNENEITHAIEPNQTNQHTHKENLK